jgi:WD40 repeat protein
VQRKQWSAFRQNALSADGRLGAVHTPKQIQMFDIETAQELYRLPKGGDEVRAVIFAGNARIVTADKKRVIDVWDAQTGKAIRQFNHGAPVEFLAASADGRRLATLEHHTWAVDRFLDKDHVHIWDLTAGTRKHLLEARPKRWFMQAQFSPDGKLLVTSSVGMDKRELTVWNVETAEKVHEVDFSVGNVLAFIPKITATHLPRQFSSRPVATDSSPSALPRSAPGTGQPVGGCAPSTCRIITSAIRAPVIRLTLVMP